MSMFRKTKMGFPIDVNVKINPNGILF